MKFAVQTGGPAERIGLDPAYRLIADIGFDAVDANVDHLLSYGDIMHKRIPDIFLGSDRDVVEAFRPWGEAAKKYGLENYQAHAPFPSLVYDPDDPAYNDLLLEILRKTVVGAGSIGCHHLIIHPFFYGYENAMSPEEEWETNIERYSRLIPAAKEHGVMICLENMFSGYKGKLYRACCNEAETAARYIDTLNDLAGEKCFGFCLDTGHALLVGNDIYQFMVTMGDRIEAFHVHDNDGVHDQHLAPYTGILDWNGFMEGLKAIRFDKTLSFETFNIWNTVDQEVAPEMMRFILSCGRMFARRAGLE